MKKQFILGLGLALGLNLSGQTTLDTVVVSGAKMERSLLNTNRNVQIISKAEIAQSPVNTVAELLDFAMGVDAKQRGIFGTQTDLSIRGGSFEQVLVLINGVRLSDPQTGHHLMNLPVSKNDIERIEILMGGGSYIFGANAFSGAINIITKEAESNSTTVSLDAGQYGTFLSELKQNLKGENWQASLAGRYNRSDGFKRNTDFEHANFTAQASHQKNNDRIELQAGYTDQAFGAQYFYSDRFPEQFEKTKTLFGSVNWQSTYQKSRLNRSLYYRRNWDEFQLFREDGDGFYEYRDGFFIANGDTAPSFYTNHYYHRSDVAGAKMDYEFKNLLGETALSGDLRHEQVRSNNLGDSLSQAIEFENSRRQYTLGADRQNLSLALQHIFKLKNWNLSAAVQANYNTDFGWGWYPALNAGYRFASQHRVYSSFNRSFRFPSYTELYYSAGNAKGSSTLQEEESYNYELGYRFFGQQWYGNASLFYRNGSNIIDWTQACASCDLLAGNNSTVNMYGFELSIRKMFAPAKKSLLFNFVELGYSYLESESPGAEEIYNSLYVFDHLRHKINLRAAQSYKNWSLNYFLSYQERNGEYTEAESGQARPFDPVFLINLSLQYQWEELQLRLQAQNLLNQSYFDRGNVEMPGMWLQLGFSYNFRS